MKFGSWTYDGFKLDLDFYGGLEEVDLSDYVESNDLGITGHKAVRNYKYSFWVKSGWLYTLTMYFI